jgi:hypothetical protein
MLRLFFRFACALTVELFIMVYSGNWVTYTLWGDILPLVNSGIQEQVLHIHDLSIHLREVMLPSELIVYGFAGIFSSGS